MKNLSGISENNFKENQDQNSFSALTSNEINWNQLPSMVMPDLSAVRKFNQYK